MKNPTTIKEILKEFDEKFCVVGQDAFFDIIIGRTVDLVDSRKPKPSEIKSFIRASIEKVLETTPFYWCCDKDMIWVKNGMSCPICNKKYPCADEIKKQIERVKNAKS